MDLCADMLVKHVPPGVDLQKSIPNYKNLLGFLPLKNAKNFDRWYNRWKVYPGHVKQLTNQQGFFHIVDHSYAHLANYLPDGRVGVYCHDLDAFKCILTPEKEPRPNWFKKMMGSILDGLKKAHLIFCSTTTTRQKLIELGHWKNKNILIVPYGVAEEFRPCGLSECGEYILHVGSCIARKRIDVLLQAFAKVSRTNKKIRLIQAGGFFSPEHFRQIRDLGIHGRVEQRQNLSREHLARLYRGAKCLVITSDAEGFGLPVIEGLSCGTKVVATNIPALCEVGCDEIEVFPAGDSDICADKILKTMKNSSKNPINFVEKYSWVNHTRKICESYELMSKGL